MTAPHPLEIVGGGLAGLTLGLALRRTGVPVTVFEAGDYPRHRVCGEFISGLDEGTIARLGLRELLADACPHRTVTYYHRDRKLPALSLPTPAWGISRHTLDARLAMKFVAAGGILHTQTRIAEIPTPHGRVFTTGRKPRGAFWVGLKVHVRSLELSGDSEMHLGERAYLGVTRLETGKINVCGMFRHRTLSARGVDLLPAYLHAAGLGALAERLRGAELDPASFCTSAAPLGDRRVAGPGRIRVGDACATIPAFTGNGLAMALQGADLALAPLRSYAAGAISWEEAGRMIAVAQHRRFRRRLIVAAFLQPFFLEPKRQSFIARLFRARVVPIRAFYAAIR